MSLPARDLRAGQSEMGREAVILAGGLGTRLREVVGDLPKAMAPVNGKPFLHYVLRLLSGQNFDRVILATGYKNDYISNYFGNAFGRMSLRYSVEREPMGTGGAMLLASSLADNDYFFVINGDTLFDVDMDGFQRSFLSENADLSVALKPMKNFDRYGSVSVDGQRIVSFNEKKYCREGLISGGVYILRKEWLKLNAPGEKFSFEKNMMERLTRTSLISAFISDSYFIDIGIPEDYSRASAEMLP